MIRIIAISIVMLVFCGCSRPYVCSDITSSKVNSTPDSSKMSIGIVADSQLQTGNPTNRVSLMHGKFEDKVVDVAIRPPALDYFSIDMLEYFLTDLVDEKKVDVILYLGDAANNGCKDEMEEAFKILNKFRLGTDKSREGKRTVPIFFVIGNHDYLGAGNTPYMPDRKELCDGRTLNRSIKFETLNTPITKLQLIEMASAFNNENTAFGWTYTDNVITDRERVKASCLRHENGLNKDQHKKKGCYLAGIAENTQAEVEIVLLDTSDYFDKKFSLDPDWLTKRWFGLVGWVSSAEEHIYPDKNDRDKYCHKNKNSVSQVTWLECNQKSNNDIKARIIASHYPKEDLSSWPIRFLTEGLPTSLIPLFEPIPVFGNYWVSGHTHKSGNNAKKEKIFENNVWWSDPYEYWSWNIGSTSDHEPEAGLLIIITQDSQTDINKEPPFSCHHSNIKKKKHRCDDILEHVRREPQMKSPSYLPVYNRSSGYQLFGMCKTYREYDWHENDRIYSQKNLDSLIGYLNNQYIEKDIKLCIGKEAARLETLETAGQEGCGQLKWNALVKQ